VSEPGKGSNKNTRTGPGEEEGLQRQNNKAWRLKTAATLAEAFTEICQMEAPLNERLAAYGDALRVLNFPFADAYDALVARLKAGEVGAIAPDVGDLMPPFSLPAYSGRLVGLDEILAVGPVVISFNRGHWCPFCKIELTTIANHQDEIAARGAQLVSILPDRQQFVRRLPDEILSRFIILTDIDNSYALSLGLAMWLGQRVADLMHGFGYRLAEYQGNDGWFVPLPATFVVGADGRVVGRRVDPEFRQRMEIADILAALDKAN
jgi:peroxiredoxin